MSIKYQTSWLSNFPGKIPLRVVLIVPFVLQIFAAVGLVGWLSLRNGQQAVNEVTTQLRSEITARIQQRLNTYLAAPLLVNQINADAVRRGQLQVHELQSDRYLRKQIQLFDAVSWIYYGTEQTGEFIGIRHQSDGTFQLSLETQSIGRKTYYYGTNPQGDRTNLLSVNPKPYDSRTRPWYKGAVRTGKSSWSGIYPDFGTLEPAITASYPVYNETGTLLGVCGVDLFLSDINKFLSQLKIGQSGQTFIVKRSGELVANSTPEQPFMISGADKQPRRIKASDSKNVLIRSTAQYLQAQYGNLNRIKDSQQLAFTLAGQRQLLQVTPLSSAQGIDWLIVVVVPETDFMGRVEANTRYTVLLCLGALGVALVLGVITSRWITEPIKRLNIAASNLSKGKWDKTVPVEREDELGSLAKAFNHMATQLQESFVALEQREARLAQAQNVAHVGYWDLDLTTASMVWSDELFCIFGLDPNSIVPTYLEYLHSIAPEDCQIVQQVIENAIAQGRPYELDFRIQRPDKSRRQVYSKGEPTLDDTGKSIRLFGILMDITERKQAQAALERSEAQLRQQTLQLEQALYELQHAQLHLVQSEKMSSLGQLVAGVAHEINNPVNFIYGNLTYARNYAKDLLGLLQVYQKEYPNPTSLILEEIELIDLEFLKQDLPKLLSSMEVGTNRIREIVLSLRNFSRVDQAQMKDVDIHDGLDSTLMLLQNRLRAQGSHPAIAVIKKYGQLPLIECYASQLNQVFMNILSNGIDALEEKVRSNKLEETGKPLVTTSHFSPTITINTGIVGQDSLDLLLTPHANLQINQQSRPLMPHIFIRIADNGPGIPEALLSRLFDPFFTTKPVGEGTGLGLSISHQIVVDKHDGQLQCLSIPGEGTEFVIIIPIRQNHSE